MREILEEASAILLSYYSKLYERDITFKDFHTIKQLEKRFLDFFEIIQPEAIENVKEEFKTKAEMYAKYHNAKIVLGYLSNFIKDIPEKLGNYLAKFSDLENVFDTFLF